MGWFDSLKQLFIGLIASERSLSNTARILEVPYGENVRELGGYRAEGGMTRRGRYLRSGSTERLNEEALRLLGKYGVTHVLDLRGSFERPEVSCRFAHHPGVVWLNVPLFGYDVSDPRLGRRNDFDDYLVESYLTMLANHGAVKRIIDFLARVPAGECALFHCAAGMDRTGVTAMLLLGAVGVGRRQIIADYAYSFGSIEEVDRAMDDPTYDGENIWNSVQSRISTMANVYDTLIEAYESVPKYLLACGVSPETLEVLRERFVVTE